MSDLKHSFDRFSTWLGLIMGWLLFGPCILVGSRFWTGPVLVIITLASALIPTEQILIHTITVLLFCYLLLSVSIYIRTQPKKHPYIQRMRERHIDLMEGMWRFDEKKEDAPTSPPNS